MSCDIYLSNKTVVPQKWLKPLGKTDSEIYRDHQDYPQPKPAKMPKRKMTQADRIIAKFGSAHRLAKIFKIMGAKRQSPSTICRWTYSKARGGTGGLVPASAWTDLIRAARIEGIILTKDDMDPREV